MENRDLVAEMHAQASGENWRQGNFRYQHQCRTTEFKGYAHGANIYFCFPAAGDPMKQEGRVSMSPQRLIEFRQDALLCVRQLLVFGLLEPGIAQRIAAHSLLEDFDDLSDLQGSNRGTTHFSSSQQFGKTERLVALERFNNSLLSSGETAPLAN